MGKAFGCFKEKIKKPAARLRFLFFTLFLLLLLFAESSFLKTPLPIVVLLLFVVVWLPPVKSDTADRIVGIATLTLLPLMLYPLIERFTWAGWGGKSAFVWFANYLIYGFVIWLVYLLANRVSVAVGIGGGLLLLGGLINAFTLQFRGNVVAPADLYAIGTAADVVGDYAIGFSNDMLFAAAVLFLVCGLVVGNRLRVNGWKPRAAIAAVLAVQLGGMTVFCRQDMKALGQYGVELNLYRQNSGAQNNGFYLNFAINLQFFANSQPEGYDVAALEAAATGFDEEAAVVAEALPHIIVIMSESLMDHSVFGALPTNIDPLEYFHVLSEEAEAVAGQVTVSIYGGSTSVSEFEFLTGYSSAMGYNNASPYSVYVKEGAPSLANALGQLGYTAYGFHPADSANWERLKVYPMLGFKESFFLEEFKAAGYDGLVRQNQNISDASLFGYMTEILHKNQKNGPVFLFGVTMQNHGGYNTRYEGEVVLELGVGDQFASAQEYLSILYESDKALEGLIADLEANGEPVLLLMFGDHWPNLTPAFENALFQYTGHEEQELDKYTTPYLVWSNFGADLSVIPEHTSVNYLAAYLKQAAGLPFTAFDQYLLEMAERYPIISQIGIVDENGKIYSPDEVDSMEPWLTQYKQLVYNGWLDGKNRVDDWFYYPVDEAG